MSVHFAAYPAGHPDRRKPKVIEFAVTRPRGDVTLIVVVGEIDLHTVPQLWDQLVRVLADTESATSMAVLDLSRVSFFAAAGLSILLEANALAAEANCRLFLITTVRCVDRAIEITGLAESFVRFESVDAVLTAAETLDMA
jgi:anti-sigma B factor antagonist